MHGSSHLVATKTIPCCAPSVSGFFYGFIAFFTIIAATAALLLIEWTSEKRVERKGATPQRVAGVAMAAVIVFGAVTAVNAAATLLECGGSICPDNPVGYLPLGR